MIHGEYSPPPEFSGLARLLWVPIRAVPPLKLAAWFDAPVVLARFTKNLKTRDKMFDLVLRDADLGDAMLDCFAP